MHGVRSNGRGVRDGRHGAADRRTEDREEDACLTSIHGRSNGFATWKPPQRRIPVCPMEYRPGWGQTAAPWGPLPTRVVCSSFPVRVEIA